MEGSHCKSPMDSKDPIIKCSHCGVQGSPGRGLPRHPLGTQPPFNALKNKSTHPSAHSLDTHPPIHPPIHSSSQLPTHSPTLPPSSSVHAMWCHPTASSLFCISSLKMRKWVRAFTRGLQYSTERKGLDRGGFDETASLR